MQTIRLSQPAEAALVIAHILGYWPEGKLVALSLSRTRPLHHECAAGEQHEAGPMMSFPIAASPLPAEILTLQLRTFVRTYHVHLLALVWFCDDVERALAHPEQLVEVVSSAEAVTASEKTLGNLGCAGVTVYCALVDRAQWVDVGALLDARDDWEHQKDQCEHPERPYSGSQFWLAVARASQALHPLSQLLDSPTGCALNSGDDVAAPHSQSFIPPIPAVEMAITQAATLPEVWQQCSRRSYRKSAGSITAENDVPSFSQWNDSLEQLMPRRLKRLVPRQLAPKEQPALRDSERAKRSEETVREDVRESVSSVSWEKYHYADVVKSPQRAGELLAQLICQKVRDRVILFAVFPTICSVTNVSDRKLVALMGEASKAMPDAEKVHAVIGFITFLNTLAGTCGAHAYATVAYLHWWLGEGSAAMHAAECALAQSPECSLAKLVHYAVSVQLPPPWVESVATRNN